MRYSFPSCNETLNSIVSYGKLRILFTCFRSGEQYELSLSPCFEKVNGNCQNGYTRCQYVYTAFRG